MNKILKVMCFILFALFAGINTIYDKDKVRQDS